MRRVRARGVRSRSATNPVLRDLTERVVIASKGRFDRALTTARTQAKAACRSCRRSTRGVHGRHDRRLGDRRPRARAGSAILRRSRSSCRSGSSTSTRTRATSCSIRSWVPAPRPSRPCAPGRHFVGYDTDAEYVARRARHASRRNGSARPRRSGATSRLSVLPGQAERGRHGEHVLPDPFGARGQGREGSREAPPDRMRVPRSRGGPEAPRRPRAQLPRGRRARWRLVLRRVRCVLEYAARAQAHRHAVEGAREGTRPLLGAAERPVGVDHDRSSRPCRRAGDAALQQVTGPGQAIADVVEMSDAKALARLQRYAREGRAALEDGAR